MSREISRAEAYERAHEVYSQVNFTSFDYNTIKESLLDYIKLYFPEDFNDYIESSEFIAIMEMFAYVGELLSYRSDLNAHENFITTAQRKESVLRLAKMISYRATRNLPARGLVKLTSVQTSGVIFDSSSRNLQDRKIIWNDPNNPDWKEQFLLVMNRVLQQEFGSVSPSDRLQQDDVLFELYSLNNNPITTSSAGVFSYNVQVSGQSLPMELVPVELTEAGPQERRPEVNSKFSLLYASDGLGDGSDTTGFLMFTKQGTLQRQQRTFDGITPNQTIDVNVDNINDTDVYLNNVDPDTRAIITDDPFAEALPHLVDNDVRYGEWQEVDLANSQNILFNTNRNRRKYEIETLDNDQIRLIFGDGEFSEIPSGSFDLWYRTSANQNISIPRNAVSEVSSSFTYNDAAGNIQTIRFTFSLVNSLQNASASETIDHIRRVAPSVYYTQDRMVNGRDYNSYLLQDPSILKLRAVNRTYAGDSKYITWHDPREHYEDVKIFGADLALFWEELSPLEGGLSVIGTPLTPDQVRITTIEPLLSGSDFFALVAPLLEQAGQSATSIRRTFNATETSAIDAELVEAQNSVEPFVDLYYLYRDKFGVIQDVWSVNPNTTSAQFDPNNIFVFRIEGLFTNGIRVGWNVRYRTKRLVANSQSTRFYNTNQTEQLSNFDTLDTVTDNLVVLQANTAGVPGQILESNLNFGVLAQRLINQNLPDAGLPNINELYVLPEDINSDGIPDNMSQTNLFTTNQDVIDAAKAFNALPSTVTPITVPDPISSVVYFSRESTTSQWIPQLTTPAIIELEETDAARSSSERLYKKHEGRFPLNFMWSHPTPNLGLIDPAASNIIDMYVITVAYYTDLVRFLSNRIDNAPVPPTPNQLRTTYATLLNSKMISDTVIMHPGKFKILFGPRAAPSLQAKFKVIRPANSTLTDSEIKVRIVEVVREFFDLNFWEFGETFFFTELVAAIHASVGPNIDSVVLVPTTTSSQFGDLFQIQAVEDEMFIPDINTTDIEIISTLTSQNIRQTP